MKKIILSLCAVFAFISLQAQTESQILPRGFAPGEEAMMQDYMNDINSRNSACVTIPPSTEIRTMAEWEELQGLVITWTGYPQILREIVRHAREECEVIIVCSNQNSVQNSLTNGGVDWSSNVTFIEDDYDSVWVRDYGPNTVYLDGVDNLALVDWIYNRPRPEDDAVPTVIADELGLPLYCTTTQPTDLVHTGGNFMADGLGKAFSSELVLEENDGSNQWGMSNHSEADIDQIMLDFMGITEYPKMTVLPFDAIHHIDMHMKLLDEETLLVGEYPTGVADGPQIEANIQYVLNNFTTSFGTPFRVIRMPMPPDGGGNYPDDGWWADYRTYTNAVFVNKTILLPIYEEQYDTTAIRIWEEALPGYNVVGIDCNEIIPASGAIHCITKEIGVADPLQIVHQRLPDVTEDIPEGYVVDAMIRHATGIDFAVMYYKTDLSATYQAAAMSLTDATTNTWSATIPTQPDGTTVYYYVNAEANSGKNQNRPITAPEGYWEFDVAYTTVGIADIDLGNVELQDIFPNPARAITCIPVTGQIQTEISIEVTDILGRQVEQVYEGILVPGESKFFIDAQAYEAGTYFVNLYTKYGKKVQKLIVQ